MCWCCQSLFFDLIAPLKPLHPPGGIHYSLLTSEEGMTLTAYLYPEELLGSTSSKGITTGTSYLGIGIIFRMNLLFHFSSHLYLSREGGLR